MARPTHRERTGLRALTALGVAALALVAAAMVWGVWTAVTRRRPAPVAVVRAQAFAVSADGREVVWEAIGHDRFCGTLTHGKELVDRRCLVESSRPEPWLIPGALLPAWSRDGRLAWSERTGDEGRWGVRYGVPGEAVGRIDAAALGGAPGPAAFCAWGPGEPRRLAFLVGDEQRSGHGWTLVIAELATGQAVMRVPKVTLAPPSWSPRGDHVALFTAGSGPALLPGHPQLEVRQLDLCLVEVPGGRKVRLLEEAVAPVVWTADGSCLFVSARGGRRQDTGRGKVHPTSPRRIWRVPLSGRARLATQPPPKSGEYDLHPAIGPGDRLAFVRSGERTDKILVALPDGVRLVCATTKSLRALQWDPSGDGLWCIAENRWHRASPRPLEAELCWVPSGD